MVFASTLNAAWSMFVLALYFYLIQVVVMTTNKVFMSFADFMRIGFRRPTAGYKVAYIIHYTLRDKYIANTCALTVSCSGLIVTNKAEWSVFIFCLYAANLMVMPSHVHLSHMLTARALHMYLIALLLPFPLVAWRLFHGHDFSPTTVLMCATGWMIAAGGYSAAIDRASLRMRAHNRGSWKRRRLLLPIKGLSIFLFKDHLLFQGILIQNLIMGVALFVLLAQGTPREFLPSCALFAIATSSLLMSRKDKKYRLLHDDSLFREQALPRDQLLLRRRKLLTLASGTLVQLLAYCVVVSMVSAFHWRQIPLVTGILITTLVIDASLLHHSSPTARWLRTSLKYCLSALFLVVSYTSTSHLSIWIFCAVLAGAYGPFAIRDLIPSHLNTPKTSRPLSPKTPDFSRSS